jgi:hypothetical protein
MASTLPPSPTHLHGPISSRPCRCGHPLADAAFSALNQAFLAITQHISRVTAAAPVAALLQQEEQEGEQQSVGAVDMTAEKESGRVNALQAAPTSAIGPTPAAAAAAAGDPALQPPSVPAPAVEAATVTATATATATATGEAVPEHAVGPRLLSTAALLEGLGQKTRERLILEALVVEPRQRKLLVVQGVRSAEGTAGEEGGECRLPGWHCLMSSREEEWAREPMLFLPLHNIPGLRSVGAAHPAAPSHPPAPVPASAAATEPAAADASVATEPAAAEASASTKPAAAEASAVTEPAAAEGSAALAAMCREEVNPFASTYHRAGAADCDPNAQAQSVLPPELEALDAAVEGGSDRQPQQPQQQQQDPQQEQQVQLQRHTQQEHSESTPSGTLSPVHGDNSPSQPPPHDDEPSSPSEPPCIEGILLVTARQAMKGAFPLNGTYFQINEVFVDASSVEQPVKVGSVRACPHACMHARVGVGKWVCSRVVCEVSSMDLGGAEGLPATAEFIARLCRECILRLPPSR